MTFNAGIEAAALKWPNGCHDPDSCSRHKRCMYVPCINVNRDLKDEIAEATANLNTRPSSSAPVERREAVARIIDPGVFDASPMIDFMGQTRREQALAKADAILSLPGSSRDEDQSVQHMTRVFAEALDCSEECKPGSCSCRWFAIRALKSGVAK